MHRLLFAISILFSFSFPVMSQSEQSIEAMFADFNRNDAPGAAVMVIKEGKTVFAKGYGLADVSKNIVCSTNTNFRLASVSKQFTAMAILILVERKSVALEDKITKFFPEFPEYGNAISVRHLLTHTSGLMDYEDVIPGGTTIPVSDRDVLLLMLEQNRTYFPPGTDFRYSNTGYALLARIVEVVSGKTFASFLRESIFEPIGMSRTVAYERGISVVTDRAFGYAKMDHAFEFSDQSLTSSVLGDGGIYSSLADLYLWDQALYSTKLIGREMLQQMFTAHSEKSDFAGNGYGFGWYIGKHRGVDRFWHYGSTCGFSTQLDRFPEKELTVVVLINRRDARDPELTRKIADHYW